MPLFFNQIYDQIEFCKKIKSPVKLPFNYAITNQLTAGFTALEVFFL